ncbi:CHASE domain-containing protein [Pseudomonas xionganensis]|uniref:histidine kinase n=1 Tax=Pseudomonas xionganensis TaxID=2654845 RepID=A0A6I4KR26_9PSED|nr:CHASE domain-containing protein [Pseudomonas xionganensis]MVW74517.1 PAS domain S-box protein [Pseudomonas xionganensis]
MMRPPIPWFLHCLLLVAVYALAGRLALLAIPPGFASAIFPPIGIALAATLLWGYRLLPGVWLGSTLLNLSIAPALDANAVQLALVIASGSTLACALGAWLIQRLVGYPDPLTDERSIFLTLLLGGPLACLVSAALGSGSLVLFGVIPLSHWPISAWTWWVGDSIGVLIALPLTLILFAQPRVLWRSRASTVGLPLLAGCALVVLIFLRASQVEQNELRYRVHEQAKLMLASLQLSFRQQSLTLQSIERLFAASQQVERDEFKRFVTPLRKQLPGLHALSWNPWISAAERPRFEQQQRELGLTDFHIRQRNADGSLQPAGSHMAHTPILYIEPASDAPRTLGVDVYVDPLRQAALNQARDSGEQRMLAPISLIQDDQPRPGVLLYQPVYRGKLPATVTERRQQLYGFVVAVLRADELIEHALAAYPRDDYQLQVLDIQDTPALLYGPAKLELPPYAEPLLWREQLEVAGRLLQVSIAPSTALLNHQRSLQSWAVLAGGLLLCSLLGGFLLSVSGRAEQIRQQVRQRTLELSTILDHAAESILIFDVQGRVERANPATAALFGLQPDQLHGLNLSAFLPSLQNPHWAFHTAEQGRPLELLGRHADGRQLELEISLSRYQRGEQLSYIGVLRDISPRKQVERLKSEFVSTVSHELRTPLTSIKGSLGLLLGGVAGPLPEQASQLVQIAQSNSERLISLVNDILDIEKLESGRAGLHLEPLDLRQQLQQALAHNQGYADSFAVHLTLDTQALPEHYRVQADALRLQQVLSNLISNAVKFSSAGQQVTLCAEVDGQQALISVSDQGTGIDPAFQARIFQRFAQADGSDSRRQNGTGLGLSICKALVERMQGSIGFTSSSAGTRFYFSLPLA